MLTLCWSRPGSRRRGCDSVRMRHLSCRAWLFCHRSLQNIPPDKSPVCTPPYCLVCCHKHHAHNRILAEEIPQVTTRGRQRWCVWWWAVGGLGELEWSGEVSFWDMSDVWKVKVVFIQLDVIFKHTFIKFHVYNFTYAGKKCTKKWLLLKL